MKQEFMRLAIQKAEEGIDLDEVPIGAVIVCNNEVVAATHNLKETKNCAVYHAEILAICEASAKLDNWYLDDCEMYTTLEPCAMCAGAIINARLKALYFGAYDPKSGCCGSVYNLIEDNKFNHTLTCEGGILKEECGKLISDFFKKKRIKGG